MTQQIFTLPDVGEGLTEAEIVAWKVKAGDTVAINDIICEIETAKSLVELPSPYAGTVLELLAPEHETIEVGTAIIAIGEGGSAPAHDGAPSAVAAEAPVPVMQEPGVESGPLVGSGPKADAAKRRPRRTAVERSAAESKPAPAAV